MRHKLTIVAMILMAAIFIASPVLAAGSSRTNEVATKATIISMTATILDDNVGANNTGTFVVAIRMTNRAFIQYRGEVETVIITGTTKCFEWQRYKKSLKIDCSLLSEKDKVSINAKLIGGKFYARRVQVYQPRIRH